MHRILLVGDSLFADTLRQMLCGNEQVEVVGDCAALEQLPARIKACKPDVVVVADTHDEYLCTGACLRIQSNLPIIYTTLKDDHLTIFTSRRVKAAQSQLFAAITALPNHV